MYRHGMCIILYIPVCIRVQDLAEDVDLVVELAEGISLKNIKLKTGHSYVHTYIQVHVNMYIHVHEQSRA